MNQRKARFDFIGKRKIWFIISLIVVLIGVAGYFIQGGFNFGIDFLGGSLIEVEFDSSTDEQEERNSTPNMDELSEEMKEHDRIWARKILKLQKKKHKKYEK